MKSLLVGTVAFSKSCLEAMLDAGIAPAAVLGRRESSDNADFVDVVAYARAEGIEAHYVDKLARADEVDLVRQIHPDLLLVMGWSYLISAELRGIVELAVGSHPAPLPVGRGRHPIVWTIFLGLRETALTFFELVDAPDAGAILWQRRIRLEERENAQSLYTKIQATAKEDLPQLVRLIGSGKIERRPQIESEAVVWRRRTQNDGVIDWRMSTTSIDRLVRALTHPYIGASFTSRGRLVRVWKVQPWQGVVSATREPGKVLAATSTGFVVKTSDGAIEILEHELDVTPTPGEYL